MKLLKAMFGTSPATLAANQLHQARIQLLETEAALEYHEGMAEALKRRVSRLEAMAEPVSKVKPVTR